MMDFMLLMHLYATWSSVRKNPQFSCANPEHVDALIQKIRTMAEAGVGHIMVCADDWTPLADGRYVNPTEADNAEFGSAAAAHAYLMNRLQKELRGDFPELELALCPPPYSLDHGNLDGHKAMGDYFEEFNRLAAPEIMLVWTGRHIVSEKITHDDYLEFSRMLPGRRLYLWDNSESINPIQMWTTAFYPGFDADCAEIIYLNMHALSHVAQHAFRIEMNDYLWNPAGYDVKRSFFAAFDSVHGTGSAELAWDICERLEKLFAADPGSDFEAWRSEAETILADLPELEAAGYPGNSIKSAIERVIALNSTAVPEYQAPVGVNSLAVADWRKLTDNDTGAEVPAGLSSSFRLAVDSGTLFIDLKLNQPLLSTEIAKIKADPGADNVFHNPETVEMFIQPSFGGDYLHLAFDVAGNKFDELTAQGGAGWDPAWRLEIEKTETSWTAHVAIPLVELERLGTTAPAHGNAWRLNIFRVPFGSACQSFSSSGYGFHTKELFGKISFKEIK